MQECLVAPQQCGLRRWKGAVMSGKKSTVKLGRHPNTHQNRGRRELSCRTTTRTAFASEINTKFAK
eukprot:COSAG04_NODE_30730_length_261_cov_0.629630_1_plen_65_part_01